MDTTPNHQASLDKKIAVGLCRLLDSLNIIKFHGDLEGLEVDQVQHRLKAWAAREMGLLDELTTSSPSPSILPPHFGPAAQA